MPRTIRVASGTRPGRPTPKTLPTTETGARSARCGAASAIRRGCARHCEALGLRHHQSRGDARIHAGAWRGQIKQVRHLVR